MVVEHSGHILGRTALGPIPRDQEEGMRHARTQTPPCLRMRRTDHRTETGVPVFADALTSPFTHQIGDALVNGPAVFGLQFLYLTA